MTVTSSKLRRSAGSAGPVLIALLLGVVLVASSALSYRDAKTATAMVAERQGIGFLHRVERLLGRRAIHQEELRAVLEANHALGLTYIAVLEHGVVVEQVGEPLLGWAHPAIGAPTFGEGRVRMMGLGRPPGPPPTGHGSSWGPPNGPGSWPPGGPAPEPSEHPPLPTDEHRPELPPAFQPTPPHELIVEFEPIGSENARHRALAVLILSSSAAGLLTVAALILGRRARRAEQAEIRLAAQRHLAQLGEMSAVMAHEIRNPLAALKGHAQLLAEKVDDPALAARVDRIINEAIRLEQLTTDLLDFARSGAINVAAASPSDLLERAAQSTVPERIVRRSDSSPPVWSLDGTRIEQVLINLLENALAVTPDDQQVEAQALREGDALVYTVRDHGPGVPASERQRIFEPFHTTKLRGTGLGLPVAKRIVELHHGRIDVVDAVGGGAQFRVYIPRTSEATR
ncbi:MAG TPA: ATP-binding protein [Polyangia bacterium]|jgi:two-component system sensor histidine kinase HydH